MTFKPGVSGNPHGNRHRTRHLLNQEFMQALLLNFRHEGRKAIEKVARNQPAAYLKILALVRSRRPSRPSRLCSRREPVRRRKSLKARRSLPRFRRPTGSHLRLRLGADYAQRALRERPAYTVAQWRWHPAFPRFALGRPHLRVGSQHQARLACAWTWAMAQAPVPRELKVEQSQGVKGMTDEHRREPRRKNARPSYSPEPPALYTSGIPAELDRPSAAALA
jgi:hypothetical protein